MAGGLRYIFVALLSIPLLFLLYYVAYGPNDTDTDTPKGAGVQSSLLSLPGEGPQFNWRTVNLQAETVSNQVKETAPKITVEDGTVNIQNAEVYYKQALPVSKENSAINILLLHGAAFTSATWLDLGTIKILAAMGYKVVAIDIPGFGKSPKVNIKDRVQFLDDVIEHFQLKNPVIVSPSMSGYYSLPFLLQKWQKMAGYVPVAPVGIEVLQAQPCSKRDSPVDVSQVYEPLRQFLKPPLPDLSCIKVPALVVFGELDRSLSSALLSLLPNSQAAEIPNGKHPAYLDNPELWHQLLYNFLLQISLHMKSN